MARIRQGRWLVLGLAVVVVLVAASPAVATYDKLFRFTNDTGQIRRCVKATLNGLEVIVGQYGGTNYPFVNPGVPGTEIISGVYCTTLFYGSTSTPVASGDVVKLGWTTSDSSCRLRDMSWVQPNGTVLTSVVPSDLGAVPGTGTVTQNPDGSLTVTILNDTGQFLDLSGLQFGVFGQPLTPEQLSGSSDNGAVGELILELRASVYAHWNEMPPPDPGTLVEKLNDALGFYNTGMAIWTTTGDAALARTYWVGPGAGQTATGRMQSFIDEIKNRNKPKDPAFFAVWVAQAQIIIGLLNGLPVPATAPLPPAVLFPGEMYQFTVPAGQAATAGALAWGGTITDEDGNEVLSYQEQYTITQDMTPPVVEYRTDRAPLYTDPVSGDWYASPVTVTLSAADIGPTPPGTGLKGMIVTVDGRYLPKLNGALLSPPGFVPWTKIPMNLVLKGGVHYVGFMSIDNAGNSSAQMNVRIQVIQ